MILDKIVAEKKKEIAQAKKKIPLTELKERASSFIGQKCRFQEAVGCPGQINLIAEIKKSSPSCGLLREDFDPVMIAQTYQAAGASAISILTEEKFFQGKISYLPALKEVVEIPLLRKDFIIDEYQLYESVCAGADALLLIARLLSKEQLQGFLRLCEKFNLDVLCEVHNEEDLDKTLGEDFPIIGINNRNLDTFAEDLRVSARLMKRIPQGKIVVSESAIKSSADVKYLCDLGVNAVLIGEAFMRSPDITAKVKELMGGC